MKIIDDIEQNSPEWFEIRDGNITGTTKVTAFTGKKFLVDFWRMLANRVVVSEDSIETARDRGHRLEDEAVQLAAKELGIELYKPVAVCISDEDPRIMYSPDRLAKPTKGKFTIDFEAKCFEGAAHLEAVIDGYIPDKTQMIRPFTVNPDLKTRYYVFYHDRIEAPKLRMKIMEIKREDYNVEIEVLKERDQEALAKMDYILEEYTF
jgi:hypothetical protein